MGYSTEFNGAFFFDRKVDHKHRNYINQFSHTRRMMRKEDVADKMDDPLRIAVGLPVGQDSEYFVGGHGHAGQDDDESIAEYNCPPSTQPSLWCKWIVSDDGTKLEWDGSEKFYSFVEWLEYLVEHFFIKWGYSLSGRVNWQGEDPNDSGVIFIEDNKIVATERMAY